VIKNSEARINYVIFPIIPMGAKGYNFRIALSRLITEIRLLKKFHPDSLKADRQV